MNDHARVASLRVRNVSVPLDKPMDTPIGLLTKRTYTLVELTSTDGLTGYGYVRAYNDTTVGVAAAFAADIGELLIGRAVMATESAYEAMLGTLRLLGKAGPQMYAIAALDTAMWDLKARVLGVPLFELLGGARDRIGVYGSGLMLDASVDELVEEIQGLTREGFKAIKMRVGKPDLAEDVERIAAVRQVFDGDLMVDAATAWTPSEAWRAVRALEPLDVFWVEDPLPPDAWRDLAALNAKSPVPIAGGEHLFKHSDLMTHLGAGAYGYLILDLQRIGGVTGWVRAANLALGHGMGLASHVFPEIAVHLLCGVSNGFILEYLPWANDLYEEAPSPAAGEISPPDGPGLGLRLDEAFIGRHVISDRTVTA